MVFFKNTVLVFLCVLLCVFSLWLTGYGWFIASTLNMKAERTNEITDAIIVLTGGSMRIETGLNLFAKGRASHLFISGIYPGVNKQDIIQKWTGEISLPPCCITLGDKAHTTVQNANETMLWLSDKTFSSIRLITADFHMIRAHNEFKHAMPDIKIITHPITQPHVTFRKKEFWRLTFTEYHKTVFRWIKLLFTHQTTHQKPLQNMK